MKKVFSTVLVLISIFFVACSNMTIGFEDDSVFYQGGIVYIYLDKQSDASQQYEVFVNDEDTEVTLIPNKNTRFGIKPGETKIAIKMGNRRALLEVNLKASTSYYFHVTLDESNKLSLHQVQKNSLDDTIESTPLYLDEKNIQAVEKVENKELQEGETIFSYEANSEE